MLLMTSFPIVVTKLGKSKEGAGEWAVSSKCEINPMRLTHIFTRKRTSVTIRPYNHKSQINNVRKSKTSNSSFQK